MDKWGVSPALIVSLYGTDFTIDDFCQGLELIHRLRFQYYQPEIYRLKQLETWIQGGARKVGEQAADMELNASQFVVHFLMDEFGSTERLTPSSGLEQFKKCLDMLPYFKGCKVITLPIGPFSLNQNKLNQSYQGMRARLVEKIGRYHDATQKAGYKLALEVLPLSLIGGIEGFLTLCREIGSPDLGMNLDTGHARACGEIVSLLPERLQGRLFGLHIKDHSAAGTACGTPGTGDITWSAFLKNLFKWNYQSSFDLEINCDSTEVEREYQTGLRYLKALTSSTQTPTLVEIPQLSRKEKTNLPEKQSS